MPRTYARIATAIWSDDDWKSLPLAAQWAYQFLLEQPKITLAGCLDVKLARWARANPDLTEDILTAHLEVLEDRRYIRWDRETDELAIRTFVKNDGVLKNRNLGKGMWAAWASIESPELRSWLAAHLPDDAYKAEYEPPFEQRPEPPADPVRTTVPETPPEPVSEPRFEPQSEPASEPPPVTPPTTSTCNLNRQPAENSSTDGLKSEPRKSRGSEAERRARMLTARVRGEAVNRYGRGAKAEELTGIAAGDLQRLVTEYPTAPDSMLVGYCLGDPVPYLAAHRAEVTA